MSELDDSDNSTRADQLWMRRAIELASEAAMAGEVPVGAVLVDRAGQLLAESFNRPIACSDPTAHAEILALRRAGERLGNYRLPGTTLYVTLEPCPMCAGAMVHARIDRLVYGTTDPRSGAVDSVFRLLDGAPLNHRVAVTGGVLADESAALLRQFFRSRRRKAPGSQSNLV